MGYITNGDIEERLGSQLYVQLSDDASTGQADEDKVTEARQGAEGEIDSYLARRYRVPVDVAANPQAAGVLKTLALDMAEYRLRARRPPVDEESRRRKDAAVSWLVRVAAGEADVPSLAELPPSTARGISGVAIGGPRILSAAELEDL